MLQAVPIACVQCLSVCGQGLFVCVLSGLSCLRGLDFSCLAKHPVCSADCVYRVRMRGPGLDSPLPGVRLGVRILCARRARRCRWVRVLRLWLRG